MRFSAFILVTFFSCLAFTTGAALGADGTDDGSRGTTFHSNDVLILPAERYVLISPIKGIVQEAPQYGRVYSPERSNAADELFVAVITPENRPNVDARLKAWDDILKTYGLRGIDPPVENLLLKSVTDPELRTAISYVIASTPGDEPRLRMLRAEIKAGNLTGPITSEIIKSANGYFSLEKLPLKLTDDQWLTALDRASLSHLRGALGLNSPEFYIVQGIVAYGDTEPNLSRARGLIFQIPRLSNPDQTGIKNLATFCDYWKIAVSQGLLSDDDIQFLDNLAKSTNSPGSGGQAAANALVKQCAGALSEIQSWEAVQIAERNRIFRLYPAPLDYRADLNGSILKAAAAELRAVAPALTDNEIRSILNGEETAFTLGKGQPTKGILPSSAAAIAWVANQWPDAHIFVNSSYSGSDKLFALEEDRGIDGKGLDTHSTFGFDLLPYRPDLLHVALPIAPGGDVWNRLVNSVVGDRASADTDPFATLIMQTVMILEPTVDQLTANGTDVSATDVFVTGQLVTLFKEELVAKITQTASSIRDYWRGVQKQADDAQMALHDGHIRAVEPVVIDSVSVGKGSNISAGTPIATLHPIYRFRIQAQIPSNTLASRYLLPGTPVQWKFTCPGLIPPNIVQRQKILSSPDSSQIREWLRIMREAYLASETFSGLVDYVDRDPASANPKSSESILINVPFEVSGDARSFHISLSEFGAVTADDIVKKLSALDFGVKVAFDGIDLAFTSGPLEIGEHCQAEFVLPSISEEISHVEGAWQEYLSGH
jgi:hypothetical protein